MDIWGYVIGTVEAEITTADAEGVFAALNQRNVELKSLRQISDLTYRVCVSRGQFPLVAALCEKRGEVLRVTGKHGLYWKVKKASERPILASGILLLLILVLWLPTRVLFVQVEGNAAVPRAQILDAAEDCGIVFGASREKVRSEKVKNSLLSAVPQLQWAGVNTSGCTATITVREKSEAEQGRADSLPASIVADRDGYILAATARKGNLLVYPGQTVLEGQVLVSAYTDCGFSIRAEYAEGEVLAQTKRVLEAVMPLQTLQKQETGEIKRRWSLLIRKKRIFLWKDSGIWNTTCGRMYKEYNILLPGGFVLPVSLCVEEYPVYEPVLLERTAEEAEAALKPFLEGYLHEHMVGKILSRHYGLEEEAVYRLTGDYRCEEMIGKHRQEQIGDTNGKDN